MLLKSAALQSTRMDKERWRQDLQTAHAGQHTRTLDRALPADHVRGIYDHLRREEAQIIAQLRTGKCRLNSYLHRIGAAESDRCPLCRQAETVRHFLVECTRWTMERAQHLQSMTPRWSDVSYLLGG